MFSEDDLIMISALQHYAFCPRQCALIHIEQAWTESGLTAEGRLMHERVHEEGNESRGNIRIARGVQLRSLRLGLIGVADVIELRKTAKGACSLFLSSTNAASRSTITPIQSSSALRQSVLRRCWELRFRAERFSMEKPGAGMKWNSITL